MDFEASFTPQDTLLEKWEACFNDILSFLSKDNHVKDKNVKKIIEKLSTDVGISESKLRLSFFLTLFSFLLFLFLLF